MTTVMVIQRDEPLMRRVRWILNEAGYEAIEAHPDDDVPAIIEQRHPVAIIFNTGMPAEQKERYIEVLRAVTDPPPIIDLHTHPGGSHAPRGVEANAFLHKPFHADDLIAAVERLSRTREGASGE
jgi:DNA-binding response OmpR family regulator